MAPFRNIPKCKKDMHFSTLPLTLRVHLLGYFEGVRVGQVTVGRGDGQDQTALLSDELQQHFSDLVLDVLRLVPHRHFGHPRQVDQGQIQH